MDITPQLLKEVKFSESWRGYDRDEVDEFLERVGAGVAQVQGRLREAVDRAEAAEARVVALGNRSDAEDTLRRTLVLAQRTADAAIAEANEAAGQTIAEAEGHAARLVSDAEAQVASMRAEAEAEVRRVIESTRAPLVDEIRELERVRSFLRDDIELLEQHVAKQRDRLREQVSELQRLVEQPGLLHPDPSPDTSGVDALAALRVEERATTTPREVPSDPATASVIALPETDDDAADEQVYEDASPDPGEDPGPLEQWGALPAFDPAPAIDPAPSPRGDDDAGGPPTRPIVALDLDAPSEPRHGDAFLDRLRAAVDDDADVDHAMAAFFDQDDDDRRPSRFGRRR